MIQISITDLIETYALGVSTSITLIWLAAHWRRWRRETRARRLGAFCELCGIGFRDHGENPLPPCPECGRPTPRGAPSL